MLPIRCFGCGKLLGNLWITWYIFTEKKCIVECFTKYSQNGTPKIVKCDSERIIADTFNKYSITKILSKPVACDYLGLFRNCCRTVMISTVEY